MTPINSLDDFLSALDNNPSWREEIRARILGEELLQLPARFNALVERRDSFIEEQKRLDDRMENHMTLTDDILSRIESDISFVKGSQIQARVAAFTEVIAANMGLDFVRALTPMQLHDIAKNITDPTANADQRESFINADLVIEGSDSDGHTVYIALRRRGRPTGATQAGPCGMPDT